MTDDEIVETACVLAGDAVGIAGLLGRAVEMERQVTLLRTTLTDYAAAVSGLPPLTAIQGALHTQYKEVLRVLEETKPKEEE